MCWAGRAGCSTSEWDVVALPSHSRRPGCTHVGRHTRTDNGSGYAPVTHVGDEALGAVRLAAGAAIRWNRGMSARSECLTLQAPPRPARCVQPAAGPAVGRRSRYVDDLI